MIDRLAKDRKEMNARRRRAIIDFSSDDESDNENNLVHDNKQKNVQDSNSKQKKMLTEEVGIAQVRSITTSNNRSPLLACIRSLLSGDPFLSQESLSHHIRFHNLSSSHV